MLNTETDNLITNFLLGSPYPNPFNPIVNFNVLISKMELVKLNIYDIQGNVDNLLNNLTTLETDYNSNNVEINIMQSQKEYLGSQLSSLEKDLVSPETIIKNIPRKIKCSVHEISDIKQFPKDLSVEDILIRSSNIGTLMLAQKVGEQDYRDFIKETDLLETHLLDN